ncbi:MAG: protein NO VEIN domain-containing protein [Vicinamibacteria bacterium]
MFWIYKCNSGNHPYQVAYGDWNDFFIEDGASEWGSTEWVPALADARPGDTILAYQTDRNELVGLARVSRLRPRSRFLDLILKPIRKIGVKVRPLKILDPRIAAIPALKPGPIRTLYPIAGSDAKRLLRAAGVHIRVERAHAKHHLRDAMRGGGFGTPETNRLVEGAAMRRVTSHFRRLGWTVKDISREERGYDLLCKRARCTLCVEVKGVARVRRQFPITAREKRLWATDKAFVPALVTRATRRRSSVELFRGPETLRQFHLVPISYMAS